jgi:hypothetical protein
VKKFFLATAAVIIAAIVVSPALGADSNTTPRGNWCAPRITNVLVLQSINPNKLISDWNGGGIGTSWSFIIKSHSGAYLKGDLMTAKGNVAAKNVFVPTNEWSCGTQADWEAGKLQ